jgi:hypothetical protein
MFCYYKDFWFVLGKLEDKLAKRVYDDNDDDEVGTASKNPKPSTCNDQPDVEEEADFYEQLLNAYD